MTGGLEFHWFFAAHRAALHQARGFEKIRRSPLLLPPLVLCFCAMDWKNKLYFGDNLTSSVAAIYDRRFFIVEKSRRSQTAATASRKESAAGNYEPKDFHGRYPRLQILTIAELLDGKKIQFPEHRVEIFAKAERKTKHEQEELF